MRLFKPKKRKDQELPDALSQTNADVETEGVQSAGERPRLGLSLLYDGSQPQSDGSQDPPDALDFIAVHGLGGHPVQSFTDRSTGCCWLKDLLPKAFPRSRMFSYGYDSRLTAKESRLRISDISNMLGLDIQLMRQRGQDLSSRSLVFLAHNLGGLVVKQLMIDALRGNTLADIRENATGILFFGTPHRGSSTANIRAKLVRLLPRAPINKELLDAMETGADETMRLNHDFTRIAMRLHIASFYETMATNIGKTSSLVVEKDSAVLGFPNEIVIAQRARHRDLCKFANESDPNYQHVLYQLRGIVRWSSMKKDRPPLADHDTPSQTPTYSWIPNIASKKGITSSGLLEMASSIENPVDFSDAQADIVAIHGLGGSSLRSWTSNISEVMWLRDLLQAKFSNCRVLSYGYKVAFKDNTLSVQALASDFVANIQESRTSKGSKRRPLILIGYSFGGVIVKQAFNHLNYMTQEPQMRDLLSSIKQVIFMGTPHDVDDPSFPSRWTAIIQATSGVRRVSDFNVESSIEAIRGCTRAFGRIRNVRVASIAESELTVVPRTREKTILATPASVRVESDDNDIVFVAKGKNHLELPIFDDESDPTYLFICNIINRVLRTHSDTAEAERENIMKALYIRGLGDDVNIVPDYLDGTCEWIFQDAKAGAWFQHCRGVLLLKGEPGCGKSCMAKYLANTLPIRYPQPSRHVAEYYCNFRESVAPLQRPLVILRSLLYQLTRSATSLLTHASKAYRSLGAEFAGSLTALKQTLISIGTSADVICVIDGLDEYFRDDARDFLRLLTEIGAVSRLGFLVTTRPYSAPTSLEETEKMTIVDFSAPSADIELYIKHRLDTINKYPLSPKQSPDLQRDWVNRILEKGAQTSFLWVSLVLRSIENASDYEDRLEKWSALSDDPVAFFLAILQTIVSSLTHDQVNSVIGVLYLLAVTEQPVTVHFLEAAFRAGDRPLQNMTATLACLTLLVTSNHGRICLMDHGLRTALLSDRIGPLIKNIGWLTWTTVAAHDLLARMTLTQVWEQLYDVTSPTNMAEFDEIQAYSAKYWVVHFREAEYTLDARFLRFAYEVFDQVNGLPPKWISTYEELTVESIPHHRTLGPLFGGCYFGLRTVVERALGQGVDIEAEDQFSKTPLHWSSELAHIHIVDALLSNGASAATQGYAGWTALHFAAQNGHSEIVKLLIQKAAVDLNIKAFDGKTPLHLAIEFNHIKVVSQLLEAGADPSSEIYTGDINGLQLAHQYGHREICQLLLSSAAASHDLLRDSINQSSHEMLALLLRAQADIVKESYPWTVELLEQNIPPEEISDLLLKSENLQWIDAGSWPTESDINWQNSKEIAHQDSCIHQLDPTKISRQYLHINPLEDDDLTGPKSSEVARSPSSSGSITSLSDGFLDPLEYFGRLERREQTIVRLCGIGGIFPPNYDGLNPGFAILSGKEARIMYGDFGEAQPLLPIAVSSTRPALPAPKPRVLNSEDDATNVETDDNVEEAPGSLDPLETSTVSDESYDSLTDPSNFEIWDQKLAQKIARALENVLGAIHYLRNDDGCCESFTVLVSSSIRAGVLSMKRIDVASLLGIRQVLEEYCHGSESKPPGWTASLALTCLDLLQALGFGGPFDLYLKRSLGSTISPSRCLHLAAQIAQICSIGLVTYTRGHSRDFQTDHLSRPIDVFSLYGSDSLGPSISARRVQFACLNNMLRRKVWTFCLDKDLAQSVDETFYLSTSIQDLIDTWGGNVMLDQTFAHTFVEIGGGSVHATNSNDGAVAFISEDEVLCHWSPQTYPGFAMKGSVIAKDKLLIGVTCVNENCLLDYESCQQAIPPGALQVMGTRSPSWKLSSRAINLGVSAKGFVTGGVSLTQVKDNGKFQKPRMMEKCKNPHILNKPWGLELSLCTGIARRVLLREFFYGEVLEHLAMELAGEWNEIKDVAGSIATSSDAEFDATIKNLTKPQAKVMRKATESLLLAMEYTKVEDDGHTLTLWWPERHEATPRGLEFRKNQYSGAAPWTAIIKESETCAVFGLATPRCLEHHDIKTCRNSIPPAVCFPENIMLNTYLVSAATELMSLPLSCAPGQRLRLYKREDTVLEITRAAIPLQNVVRVKFIPGQRPVIMLKKWREKWQEVLERQARGDRSQEVLVL